MTLWAGRVGRGSPRGVGVPARRRRGAAAVRLRGDAPSTRAGFARPACSRERGARARSSGARRRSHVGARPTRTCTRRSSASSARSGGRSTPAARGTTRSPRRSGSTSPTPAREAGRRSSAFARRGARPRRGRGGDADARLHAPPARASRSPSATTCSRGWRCSIATAAASRPPASGARRCRSARARSPARRSTCRRPPRADAELARRGRRPRLRARLPLRVAVLFTHLSRIGEELVLWSASEFGFVRLPEKAATGSSMMPQKLNPDVAELVRGKAGTAIGAPRPGCSRREGAPARVRPRPAGGQGAGVRGAARRAARRWPRSRVLVAGLDVRPRAPRRGRADPLLLATDAAEALVRAASRSARRTSASPRPCATARSSPTRRGAGARARPARAACARRSRTRAPASASRSHVQRRSLTRGREAAAFRGVRVGDPLSRIPQGELSNCLEVVLVQPLGHGPAEHCALGVGGPGSGSRPRRGSRRSRE